MSDTVVSLRRKIESAGDLQSVVRTMKALAAANIGQYERAVCALSDYYRTVELGLRVCLREGDAAASVAERYGQGDARVIGAVVFGSDQGLVGRFNEIVAAEASSSLRVVGGHVDVWAVGDRVHARLVDAGVPMTGLFGVPSSVKAIAPLVGQILLATEERRGQREITELYLFYNHPKVNAGYEPVQKRLLPLDGNWQHRLVELPWPTQELPEVVGADTTTLRALIREYLFVSLFRACAESLASENASRLAAMERADENINTALATLRGAFHRLRQSGIDEELFDVVSGFEALSRRKTRDAKS
jgi:F-type H+-transporting ATPase subunit gamma